MGTPHVSKGGVAPPASKIQLGQRKGLREQAASDAEGHVGHIPDDRAQPLHGLPSPALGLRDVSEPSRRNERLLVLTRCPKFLGRM
jgi:hypothetical protein